MAVFFIVFLCLAALCLFFQSACYLRNRHPGDEEHGKRHLCSSGGETE